MRREPRAIDLLSIVIFLALIVSPLADQKLRPDEARNASVEFRAPTKRPRLRLDATALTAFPQRFEDYYNDHFGLRDRFLRWHNALKWFGLGLSPTPKFIRGKGSWMYYTEDRSVEVQRGAYPFSAAELLGWRRMLETRQRWLADQGIEYVFAVVPEKSRVYPEFFPEEFNPIGPTRIEQLVDSLRDSPVRVLYLADALVAEKRRDRSAEDDFVFFRLGTHWTDRGAFAGYSALVERLQQLGIALDPLKEEDFDYERAHGGGDTWAPRMYMADLLPQVSYELLPRFTPKARYDARALEEDFTASAEQDDPSGALPTAILFHDSFAPPLRPWLAEHFGRIDYRWTYDFDAELVRQARPSVVIQLFVERALVMLTPGSTPLESGERPRQTFLASSDVRLRLGDGEETILSPHGKTVLSKSDEQGWRIRTKSGRDMVLIAPFESSEGELATLYLDLESPFETVVDIFFETERERGYVAGRTVAVPIAQGRNELYVELPLVPLRGSLALRPGRKVGDYVLRALEVRAGTP